MNATNKIEPRHLKCNAYLYIRQSTLRQVFENQESTKRQYALRQRAIALGWPAEKVIVIDSDLGRSGASTADREGFKRLVTEVSMGRAGLVMGLEVSRLARNSTDWHRLLEICALSGTLILDEDGVYDPAYFNDRLLLGLKGTMSEAELHILRARLQGGIINKARRGELQMPLPIGYVYDPEGRVRFDPDVRIQESIRHLFRTFRRTGSATATVKEFRKEGLLFPRRRGHESKKGEVIWGQLDHTRTLRILHHPRYAGVFCFGRSRHRTKSDGTIHSTKLLREDWIAFIPDAHEAYITEIEFEENVRTLQNNAQAHGVNRERGPVREGPALLQGLGICAVCGDSLTVRYHTIENRLIPTYVCQKRRTREGAPVCQSIPGGNIDQAIGKLLVETVSPIAIDVALEVQRQIEARSDETDRLRDQEVERASFEADLARRRYMKVDPSNRLVADSLEADWNEKLRILNEAQDRRESARQVDHIRVNDSHRARLMTLATDFPYLWANPKTPDKERKRMVRLLIEDVTLLKGTEVRAQVRFKGGALHTLTVPLTKTAWQLRETPRVVIETMDKLLNEYTDEGIAAELNRLGLKSGEGERFHRKMVARIRKTHGLKTRFERLRDKGLLTLDEFASRLNVSTDTVKMWRRAGLIEGERADDRGQCCFYPPGPDTPVKWAHRKSRKEVKRSLGK